MADGANSLPQRPRRTQSERRETTRERILDAAQRALLQKGYSGASTWAISETGGFSKGALLHHFRKKSYLFQALIAERSRTSLASLNKAMDGAEPGARIEVFLDWLWSTIDDDFFAIGLEILTASRTDPELSETVRLGADALKSLLDSFIDLAVEEVPKKNRVFARSALQASVHMVRGIGLDLVIGGNRKEHELRFTAWRHSILQLL